MHHRREGYPFGSLVDFASDPLGRKYLDFVSCLIVYGFFYFMNKIALVYCSFGYEIESIFLCPGLEILFYLQIQYFLFHHWPFTREIY